MDEIAENKYIEDLQKIKNTIKSNQNKAMLVVNSAMILTYYQIGGIINKRKTWGNKYIQMLSLDLKEYGRSFSCTNLKYMSQFASEFTIDEISQQHVGQIPWGTLISVIMPKSKTHSEMLWYVNEVYKNGWSRAMALNQFSMKAYERSLIQPIASPQVKSDDSLNEIFKDTYVFDFIDKEKIKNEKDLKNNLILNIIKFLQELGPGFSLVGKEYKILTPTNKEFFIDLLLYHTKVHAYVVIEVKIGELTPADLGQLQFYVNAIDDLERTERDNETIGLLLCKEADNYVSKTTFSKSISKIDISKYKYLDELPEYLERKMKNKY